MEYTGIYVNKTENNVPTLNDNLQGDFTDIGANDTIVVITDTLRKGYIPKWPLFRTDLNRNGRVWILAFPVCSHLGMVIVLHYGIFYAPYYIRYISERRTLAVKGY